MGLFDRKYCDLCGEKIGLLGGVEFGGLSLCSDCGDRLSPWLDPEEEWDAGTLQEYLDWKEENRGLSEDFQVTREIGEDVYVYLDEDAGLFAVTEDVDPENAEIFRMEDILECSVETEEDCQEEFDVDEEGNDVSYDPPHLCYSYIFHMQIQLDHPWIREINFQLNNEALEVYSEDCMDEETGLYDPELDESYLEYQEMADEILIALTGEEPVEEGEEEEEDQWDDPGPREETILCPYCNSRVRFTDNGRCPNCGGGLTE